MNILIKAIKAAILKMCQMKQYYNENKTDVIGLTIGTVSGILLILVLAFGQSQQ